MIDVDHSKASPHFDNNWAVALGLFLKGLLNISLGVRDSPEIKFVI
jgi:hypothetical protein